MLRDAREFLSGRSFLELVFAILLAIGLFELIHAAVAGLIVAPIESSQLQGFPVNQPLTFRIGDALFYYADVVSYGITLFVLAAVLFGMLRWRRRAWAEPPLRECPNCLSAIRAAARVCEFCTRDVEPTA